MDIEETPSDDHNIYIRILYKVVKENRYRKWLFTFLLSQQGVKELDTEILGCPIWFSDSN